MSLSSIPFQQGSIKIAAFVSLKETLSLTDSLQTLPFPHRTKHGSGKSMVDNIIV
jgi:hypothetical protein